MSETGKKSSKASSIKWKLWTGVAFLTLAILAGGAVTAVDWGWNFPIAEQILLVTFFIAYCIGSGFSYVGLTELEKINEGETMMKITKILLITILIVFSVTVLFIEFTRYWEKINGQLLTWSKWIHLSLTILAAIATFFVLIIAYKV